MKVLIVESDAELATLWSECLRRHGAQVRDASGEGEAIRSIQDEDVDVIVLDLMLATGSAFAVADFASYCRPETRVIFVTNTSFFSDGSIFRHIPNACAFLPSATSPDDLMAVIDHYGVPH